jgi:hypothetical protein
VLLDYFWWRNPVPSGGSSEGVVASSSSASAKHPWIHFKEEVSDRITEPEFVEAVVQSVQKVVEKRIVQNPQVDEWKAEQEFRKWIETQKIEWMNEFSALIRMEYERIEQEYEDAQIAMLLFEM